jgi:type III secretion protein W
VQDSSIDTLLARARSLFPDDSDLVLVLRELLRRKQLSAIQRRRLEQLLEKVVSQADPKHLKAGLNCALKARLFGAALGLQPQLLRQTYRRFLCSDGRAIDDYQDWIASYGYRVRHQVLAFVEESLGCDIRAEDPSCSHVEFGYLLEHMRKLHQLRTVDREFVGGLMARRLVPPREEQEADWLLLLCALVARGAEPEEVVREALDACLLETHAQRSTWLDGVRSACKRLPPEVFLRPAEESAQAEIIRDEIQAAFARLLDRSYAAELVQQRRQIE